MIEDYTASINDTLNLSDKEKRVLEIIKEDPHIVITQIVVLSGFSRSTVTRALDVLQSQNLIQRVGAKKSGYWKVKR